MSHDCIAIHFTDLQTTLRSTATRRLMRSNLLASLATRLPLVLHHMLQTHTIHRAHEDRRLDLLARCTIVEYLIAILFKSHLLQNATNGVLRRSVIHESSSISNRTR